ncbi:peptidase M17 [Taibaiella sp. KBW10]|uniref:leucyl aminopeptidase family protein n=1 Tax=Taibaiella sp. KBW10 TaxID=2153357 RepID=UPI000F5B2724|nr:leucyl aminopeptidase [Taibaiella sp. KBW10]RQO31350.1 peptidase M17 [Taibaiella sp. KBW10]
MFFKIQKAPKGNLAYLIDQTTQLDETDLDKSEKAYIAQQLKNEAKMCSINRYTHQIYILFIDTKGAEWLIAEKMRKQGAALCGSLNQLKATEVHISNLSTQKRAAYFLAEGLSLANYQFLKYKSNAKKIAHSLNDIFFTNQSITVKELNELQTIVAAVCKARDLINEPLQYLTAEQLGKDIQALGKEGGFKVQVLGKAKIEQMKMGGIMAVNSGSILPPTFSIMEHRPQKFINKAPIVLVGKGIVYDTGGLSLKPTPNSMDRMKSDMSGAAVVAGIMYAVGMLDLPLHIIGLVPATENRPGENAYVPGDVITMYDGTTVEVLNTDAEGRLVLADALHYAKKYRPELVFDFATLTGAAANAFGDVAMCTMGTANEHTKQKIQSSGFAQFEKVIELPLWDEYGQMIKSDIADLKNIGGPTGGAITAGKFLEHFTDYPWMHFDIAGVSHHISGKDYRPTGGVAMGIRMMVDFLMNYGK